MTELLAAHVEQARMFDSIDTWQIEPITTFDPRWP
jgi:hypothetical protein